MIPEIFQKPRGLCWQASASRGADGYNGAMNRQFPTRRSPGRTLAPWVLALLMGWAALWPVPAQAEGPVHINNVAYEAPRHSVVLDITGPVTISTRTLKAPARMVIDIPTARLLSKNRELEVGDALVRRVRVSQFKIFPPTVRIVIETATETEPLIAVQQTKTQLFITLAPARTGDGSEDHGAHAHEHTPPEPSTRPAVVSPTAAPIPTPRPPAPTPVPAATPEPVATPPVLQEPISGPKQGEAGKETLPFWLQ